jgi:hypothetical protein
VVQRPELSFERCESDNGTRVTQQPWAIQCKSGAWRWTWRALWAIIAVMHESKDKESWPRWSSWALIAVIATTLLTVAVTLNDIY